MLSASSMRSWKRSAKVVAEPPMNVLVDALPLRHGGGAEFLRQQMLAFSRVVPEITFHTLRSPWTDAPGIPGHVETVAVRTVAGRFAYEQVRLPFRRTDVLFCAGNFGPLLTRQPMVLTTHNPNYYGEALRLPEAKASRPWWKVQANHRAMKRATAVVAVSHALADEIKQTLPGLANKLHVIPYGASHWEAEAVEVPGLPDRYVLSVASAAPHKRVEDVIAGWAIAARAGLDAD